MLHNVAPKNAKYYYHNKNGLDTAFSVLQNTIEI